MISRDWIFGTSQYVLLIVPMFLAELECMHCVLQSDLLVVIKLACTLFQVLTIIWGYMIDCYHMLRLHLSYLIPFISFLYL